MYKKAIPYVIVVFVVLAVNEYFLSIYKVEGISMEPFLHNGGYVLVTKPVNHINKGDVVVVKKEDREYIKRVVGIAGQVVTFNPNQNSWKIDSKVMYLEERYTFTVSDIYNQAVIIPQNSFFLLGDNHEESIDSRVFGLVKEGEIIGKVTWSLGF